MNTDETEFLTRATQILGHMAHGSMVDAQELLQDLDATGSDAFGELFSALSQLNTRLSESISSKEEALAKVQLSLFELESVQIELQVKEARFRELFSNMNDGVVVFVPADDGQDFLLQDINDASLRIEQFTERSDLIGQRASHLFPGIATSGVLEAIQRISRVGGTVHLPERYYPDARVPGWRDVFIYRLPTQEIVVVYRDITTHKNAEQTLIESEERYRAVFEGAGEGICASIDHSGQLLYCNQTWCEMFGLQRDDIPLQTIAEIHPADVRDEIMEDVAAQKRGEKSLLRDVACLRKDGVTFYCDIRTASIVINDQQCTVGFFTDASERVAYEKQLQAERALREMAEIELRHAQKMQAIGQLAAGIAHEINTPAQFVGDNIRFLAEAFEDTQSLLDKYRQALAAMVALPAYGDLAAELEQAEAAIELPYLRENLPSAIAEAMDGITRISSIVNAMKEFAHPDQREKSAVDLNQSLQSTLTIARNEYKYVADLETSFGQLPPVACHVSDINQVVLNLIVNATHAIEDAIGEDERRGTIRVETSCEGDAVRIVISDDGAGIPEDIRERVFDPFFTTKEVGRGSGQGLALARKIIVDRHDGSLTFDSEVGKGTTFTIMLPVGKRATSPEVPSSSETTASMIG